MKTRTLLWVNLLAIVSITGLVVMLVSNTVPWDRAGFLLTAAPLIVGLWRWLRLRRAPPPARSQRGLLTETETE